MLRLPLTNKEIRDLIDMAAKGQVILDISYDVLRLKERERLKNRIAAARLAATIEIIRAGAIVAAI